MTRLAKVRGRLLFWVVVVLDVVGDVLDAFLGEDPRKVAGGYVKLPGMTTLEERVSTLETLVRGQQTLLDLWREGSPSMTANLEQIVELLLKVAAAVEDNRAVTICAHDNVEALTAKLDELTRYLGLPRREARVIGTVERVPDISHEDSGMAMVAEVFELGKDWFVRIQSYDEVPEGQVPRHPLEDQIRGKKVRVTVEVVE